MIEHQHNNPNAEQTTTAIARCALCGAAGFPEDRFCPCCGAPMNRYCPSCGASITHAIALFCTDCGASLRGQGASSGTTPPPT
ncbi:MAG: hypothetical protein IT211_09020 [Armatimonadetes bacterium]|nr:hypothetical protein [Armatimonadota bacterium]